MNIPRQLLPLVLLLTLHESLCAQNAAPARKLNRDEQVAARFAPVFYQALGDKPRSDFITNFDFDNDWRGDNNWDHADSREYQLRAFVYYSLTETATHFFIHYAVFHPRDYKGGERKGTLLSELIREGAKRGGRYDPTGLADEAALAHENDLEGCLLVVAKNGIELSSARVVFIEAFHHNNFSRYVAGESAKGFSAAKLEGDRPLLYIEPKGHGIEAYSGDQKQVAGKDFLRYVYTGIATNQTDEIAVCRDLESSGCNESVGYDLIPLSTLWAKASGEANATYGRSCDYGQVEISVGGKNNRAVPKKIKVGKVGCAFLGKVGAENMARPPWAWFDKDERNRPVGRWFFDPATTIRTDFSLEKSFSVTYLQLPFWAL